MTYAFTFDSSACSGCKACQEACKDKNHLPVGVLWRRVVEVSGGGWHRVGGGSFAGISESDESWRPAPTVWENTVFAYNLSIACNHCVHPKCAGVCPTDAYVHRADGIVYIDPTKCMGCGYCSWACPYNAPRYNPELGQMSKCNFCFDNIDAGLPPSCVAACPMRVLNFVSLTPTPLPQGEGQGVRALWEIPASEHPFPLPNNSRTEPHLAVKPHRAMGNDLEKKISNYEEICPKHQKSEMPLVAFTLLVQMAVGMFWAAQWMAESIPLISYLIIGACLGLGGFFSFAHLGAKRNAWRAPFHLKKSWLSREILFVGLFGAGWLAGFVFPEMKWVTSLLGVGLIYSMAKVYQLRPMPAWNTWRTMAGFFITAILLGHLIMINLLGGSMLVWGFVVVLLAGELGLIFSVKPNVWGTVRRLRVRVIVAAMLGAGGLSVVSNPLGMWTSIPILLLVLVEEVIGRWLFYEALNEKIL
jgi:anaerobic dimethyl sulfoxide reductase subunit B (iron-sulfur subunit)